MAGPAAGSTRSRMTHRVICRFAYDCPVLEIPTALHGFLKVDNQRRIAQRTNSAPASALSKEAIVGSHEMAQTFQ